MKKLLLGTLIATSTVVLPSCNEHGDYDVTRFDGEYRFYRGIAEFFDCKSRVKYYVAKAGIDSDLQKAYLNLGMEEKDDVYIQIKGYLKEEEMMEGINPSTVFVPVKLLKIDKRRGCVRGLRQGS
ncbi:MAG: hypothetical protein V3U71_08930 [Cocleimonas sp.]